MSLVSDIRQLAERPTIIPGIATADWNSGLATSGAAGADLVTIGGPNSWFRLNQFIIVTGGFNIGATVTYRVYSDVAGVNRLIFGDDYGPPPVEVMYMSWWFDAEFFGPLRVELHSDQVVDDGLAVTYEYRIKSW